MRRLARPQATSEPHQQDDDGAGFEIEMRVAAQHEIEAESRRRRWCRSPPASPCCRESAAPPDSAIENGAEPELDREARISSSQPGSMNI